MLRALLTLFPFKKSSRRDPLGPKGERIAARYLARKGYKLLTRNEHVPVGEADLVCLAPDKNTIVIVEVKSRRALPGDQLGDRRPEAQINAHKKRKLIQVAESLANRHNWRDRPLRIDVVAVEIPDKGKPVIRHYESAVTR